MLVESTTEVLWNVVDLVFKGLQVCGCGINLNVKVGNGSLTVCWYGWLLVLEWGWSLVAIVDIESVASCEELSELVNSRRFGVAEVSEDGLNNSSFGGIG